MVNAPAGMRTMPTGGGETVTLVNPPPLPLKVPVKVTPPCPLVSGTAFNAVNGRFVNAEPSPVNAPFKLVAVIVPAEKFPDASRFTMVLTVFALVAALAALTPLATLAAVCPPTVATTVAPCVPVTSPASEPEKLMAVVAEAALVAVVAVVAAPALAE